MDVPARHPLLRCSAVSFDKALQAGMWNNLEYLAEHASMMLSRWVSLVLGKMSLAFTDTYGQERNIGSHELRALICMWSASIVLDELAEPMILNWIVIGNA